ncbi:hypothetical protein Tco_1447519 [Tanacetum coccineum]
MVETIVSATCSMMSIGGLPAEVTCCGVSNVCKQLYKQWCMLYLICHVEDSEFARRIGVLLQEMEVAYDERLDFIRELEAVPFVAAAVKTAEFLNNALWKDDRRMQRLRKLRMDADLMAYEKEKFTEKL